MPSLCTVEVDRKLTENREAKGNRNPALVFSKLEGVQLAAQFCAPPAGVSAIAATGGTGQENRSHAGYSK